jgi:hypothetical protein
VVEVAISLGLVIGTRLDGGLARGGSNIVCATYRITRGNLNGNRHEQAT